MSSRVPEDHGERGEGPLSDEDDPIDAGDQKCGMHGRHVHAGQLGGLAVAEDGVAPAVEEKDGGDHEDRAVDDQLADGLPAGRFGLGQDVHVEVGPLAHGDGRSDHDDPDEQEPRRFLCPDVAGDELRVAGHDLQGDGDDKQEEQNREDELQQAEVRLDDGLHGAGIPMRSDATAGLRHAYPETRLCARVRGGYFTALIVARTLSASTSLANDSFTGATRSRSFARSVKGWTRIFPSVFSLSRILSSSLRSHCRPHAAPSSPALRMASWRSFGSLRKVFPLKQSGRMVMACCVREMSPATSCHFIWDQPGASFSPAWITLV